MAPQREILGTGKYLELVREGTWEFAVRNKGSGVACIIPVTDDNALVLVEQWRAALNAPCIELPAGLVGDEDDAEEDMLTAAKRELEEETGFCAQEWTRVWEGASSPGLTPETVNMYLATRLTRVGNGGGTGHEDITVHVVPLDTIEGWLAKQRQRGAAIDIKVFSALGLARGAVDPLP